MIFNCSDTGSPIAALLRGAAVSFVVGFMLVNFTTVWGIGTSPDSATYLSVAVNLRSGKGLSSYTGRADAHFPPGYPATLALTALVTGKDARYGAPRLVGAACFGLLAASVFLSVAALCRDTEPGGLAAFAVLSAPYLLQICSSAWSDALFMILTMVGMVLLWQLLETGSRRFLVIGAAVFGLSVLVRYAGLFWLPASVVVLLVLPRRTQVWRRFTNALLFGVVLLAPYLVWSLYARAKFGASNSRSIAFHTLNTERVLDQGVSVMASWLVPDGTPWLSLVWVFVPLMAIWLALPKSGLQTETGERVSSSGPKYCTTLGTLNAIVLLIAFPISYFICLLISITFVDRASPADFRYLAPVQCMFLVLLIHTVHQLSALRSKSRILWSWLGFVPLVLLFSWQCYTSTIPRLSEWHRTGLGLAAEKFREHEVWKSVRRLPVEIELISNTWWSVYLLSGRQATPLPMKADYTSGKVNPDYKKQLSSAIEKVRTNKATLVYWHREYPDPYLLLPDITEMKALGLGEPAFVSKEAVVFGYWSRQGR